MLRPSSTSLGLARLLLFLAGFSLAALPNAHGKTKAKATTEPPPATAEAKSSQPPEVKPITPSGESGANSSAPGPSATSGGTASASPASDASSAQASGRKLNKAEIDEAKAQASAAFQAGRYTEAAEILRRVYESDPQPLYLFNAGQAYRKGDKPREAKTAYEQFLVVAPKHKLAPEVSGYIRDMEALLLTQKKAQEISLELDKEKAEAMFVRQALQQERGTPIYKKPLFWAGLAGGVIVVSAFGLLAFGVQAQGFSDLGNRKVK
ncbi:MAG TPA: tetratricopeptide repeat protein [Pseudomonadota bacterium]|nr:tetratricopeptide repeat protein [Pseudomonadota bacterium]